MPDVPEPMVKLVRWTAEPVANQIVRSTAAAVISYLAAVWLLPQPVPLTAPLTALLVVQVTLYSTFITGIRRVNAVVIGVVIAIAFSSLVGLRWWSLGLIILTALLVGRVVRVGEFEAEVAISAMLVLGVTKVGSAAWDRIYETLIGAAVGLLFNLLFAPPVWVQSAGGSIEEMAHRMGRLFRDIGGQVAGHLPVERAAARLHEARGVDHDITEVDASLRQAEDSLRFNPGCARGCCPGWCCAPAWTPWRSARWCCGCSRARSPTSPRNAPANRSSPRRSAGSWSSSSTMWRAPSRASRC